MADKSAQNIIDAIEASKEKPLSKFLYALGHSSRGRTHLGGAGPTFPRLDDFFHLSEEDLMKVEEVGPEVAASVVTILSGQEEQGVHRTIEKGRGEGDRTAAKGKGKLADKVFVFTGTLQSYGREEARALVESLGGKTASSVSKKVDFVVVGEDPGSKVDKAKELGIKILTEEEFKKMVG